MNHPAQLLSIGQASKFLNVSIITLRRWEKEGIITAHRTAGGTRKYDVAHLQQIKEAGKGKLRLRNFVSPTDTSETLSIGQAASLLGTSVVTLRRWEKQDMLTSERTASGARRYSKAAILALQKGKLDAHETDLPVASGAQDVPTTSVVPKTPALADAPSIPPVAFVSEPQMPESEPVQETSQPVQSQSDYSFTDPKVIHTPPLEISTKFIAHANEQMERLSAPSLAILFTPPAPETTATQFEAADVPVSTSLPLRTLSVDAARGYMAQQMHEGIGNLRMLQSKRLVYVTAGLVGVVLIVSVLGITRILKNQENESADTLAQAPSVNQESSQVLGAKSVAGFLGSMNINVPANFYQNVKIVNKNLDLGKGNLTAANVLYGIKPGSGIQVSTGQTPTITNTGVLSVGGQTGAIRLGDGLAVASGTLSNSGVTSVNGQTGAVNTVSSFNGSTGAVSLTAGSNITISGTTISASVPSVNTFGSIKMGSDTITAGSATDTLTLVAGSGISLAANTSTKQITITNSGSTCTDCVINDPSAGTNPNTIAPTGDITGLTVKQTTAGGPTAPIFAVTNSAANASYFSVGNGGNVGIGTSTPDEKVQISGAVHLDQISAPGVVSGKLYNNGGTLYWGSEYVCTQGSACASSGSVVANSTDTANQIAYFAADDSIIGTNDFTWDNGAKAFSVNGTGTFTGLGSFQNTSGITIGEDKVAPTANTAGFLKLISAGNTAFSTTFTTTTQTQNVAYTLPADDGTSNDVLVTDGNGVLTWQAVSGIVSGDITAVGNVTSGSAFTGSDSSSTKGNSLVFEGSSVTDDANDVTVTAANPVASRVYTLPDLGTNGTFGFLEGTQTFTGAKTFDDLTISDTNIALSGASTTLTSTGAFTLTPGGTVTLGDGGDAMSINTNDWDVSTAGAITGATYEGLTIGSTTGTFNLTNGKTFAVQNGLTFAGTDSDTWTFPAANSATGVVVGRDETQTLTNKTLTTPKIADLGYIADTAGNEMVVFDSVGSAVNYLQIANAATGNGISILAKGDDTNVGLALNAQSAGTINIGNLSTGDILFGGGSASTGCTVTNSTGDLTCTGAISGSNISGTNTGNQNVFSRVTVSATNIDAATTSDALTLEAGTGVTLTPNSGTKTVTISATGTGGDITSVGDQPSASAFTGANDGNNLTFEGTVNDANDVVLTAAATAATRTYTLPDLGTNGTFAFLEGSQTFSGAKTFGDLTISDTNIALSGASTTLTSTGAFTLTPGGTVTLGDGGDAMSIDTNDWDISTAGAITGATYEGLNISSTTGTFTLTNGKTFAVQNGLTFAGTDGNTWTFPSANAASGVVVGRDETQTLTNKTLTDSSTKIAANGDPTKLFQFDVANIGTGTTFTLSLPGTPGTADTICLQTKSNCAGTNYWDQVNGVITPKNESVDFLVGGTATGSAKFAVLNVNSGTPVASVAAGVSGGVYLSADGTLSTTAKQTLTLGGATTGNITLSPNGGSGTVFSTGTINLANGKTYQINGVDVLSDTTVGSGVVNSSLTSVGALSSGSIANGFGTIATANSITGTVLNATTSINTGAGAGTGRIDVNGNLTNIGTTQFNSLTYAWPSSRTGGYVLQTDGSGNLTWVDPTAVSGSVNYWDQVNGVITPKNESLDFLIGGNASMSAKFAVLNVNSGIPTASISAGAAGGTYLTATGTLSTTANQSLVLGSSTTGNITIGTDATARTLTLGNATGASGVRINTGTGNFAVNTNQFFVKQADGNVGIGTSSPNEKLQVAGAVLLDQISQPGVTADKLYNNAGTLYWGANYICVQGGSCASAGTVVANGTDVSKQIAYFTGDDALAGTNDFVWDDSAKTFGVNGASSFTKVNSAGGSLDSVTLSGTLAAFNGSDTFRGLYLNYTNANHTGASNTFNGIDIAGITGDVDATENAISVGSGWDNVLNLGGVGLSASELGLLDGRSGTLVDSANVTSYATTAVTAGSGLTGGGTTGALSLAVNLYSPALDAASSTTNSPSGLELVSNKLTLLQGCSDGEILSWNEAGDYWQCAAVTGIAGAGDITAVGDQLSGSAFTGANNGNNLTFEGTVNDANDVVVTASATAALRTYSLPDLGTDGVFAFLEGTQTFTGNKTFSSAAGITIGEDKAGPTANTAGFLKLYSAGNNAYSTTFTTATQTQDIAYTLPPDDGTSNQVLVTDGSGSLTWQTVSGIAGAGDITAVGDQTTGSAFTGANDGNSLTFEGTVNDGNDVVVTAAATAATRTYTLPDLGTNGTFGFLEGTQTFSGTKTFGDIAITDTNVALSGASTTLTSTGAFTLTPGGAVTLGDGGDTMAIDTNDWDISTAGAITGATYEGLNISTTTGTFTLTNGKTFAVQNSLTLAGTDGNTWTFPSAGGASGVVVGRDETQTLTNKTFTDTVTKIAASGDPTKLLQFDVASIGTGNTLTLSLPATPGTADTICLQTKSNCAGTNYWDQALGILTPKNESVDFLIGGTATATAKFAILNVNSGTPTASVSAGVAGGAYLTADGILATTAKQSLTLGSATTGNIILNGFTSNGGVLYTDGSGVIRQIAAGTGAQCLLGGTTPSFGSCQPGNEPFASNLGLLYAGNTTQDFGIGGTSSTSAKFAVLNVNSGTPTASVSAGVAGGTYVTAGGTIATTANQTLTLGGTTTGNITLSPNNGNGTVLSTGTLNLATGKIYQINGVAVLSATTLGSAVVSSSLTSVGALASGSIANGFGTIVTGNTITGTVINGTTGINTGAGSGTERIDVNGNLKAIGTTEFNSLTYTWPAGQASGYVLQTNGSGALSWVDPTSVSGSVNYWDQVNGTIAPKNATLDLLIGGASTAAAKFAILNINAGTPTASLSAGVAGGAYLTAGGTLSTTAKQTLALGSATTGDIALGADATARTITLGNTTGATGVRIITGTGNFVLNTNQVFIRQSDGNVGIGLTTPSEKLDVLGNLKVSGTTNFGTIAYTWPASQGSGYVLQTDGAGVLSWVDPTAAANTVNYWNLANGAISARNSTVDLLIGGQSSASAKFAVLNVTSGTPTASVSAGTAGAIYLTATGNLATTALQTLSLGGATTGNITLSPNNGTGTVLSTGTLNLSNTKTYQINGNDVLSATTLGTSVLSSSLTSVGALASGSIASGFGTIVTTNTITGTVLNGTTGINTGAGAGTERIDVNGNLKAIGTTQLNGITYTWPGSQTSGYVLQTNGSGTLSWVDPVGAAGSVNYWDFANGAVNPKNATVDLLIGGVSSSSAKFAVLNVNSGTPTASLSAGVTGGLFLTADGSIQTTAKQTLTLGGGNTGNLALSVNALTINGVLGQTVGSANCVTTSNGIVTGTGTCPAAAASFTWNTGNGTIYQGNTTQDLLIGGVSSSSAKFAVLNVNSGTPMASLSAGVNGGVYLSADGILSTTAKQSLTLGSATTGNLVLNGYTSNGGILYTNGAGVVQQVTAGTATQCLLGGTTPTFGSCQTGSEPLVQTLGLLYPGNFTLDFAIGGTSTAAAKFAVLNVNSGTPTASLSAGVAGGLFLTADGSIQTTAKQSLTLGGGNTGNLALSASVLTINGTIGQTVGSANCVTTSNGIVTGTGTCPAAAASFTWNTGNGTIYEGNTTQDLLIGGVSSASAKFAVLNVNSGTPTASVSAGAAGGAYIGSDGTIASTAKQSLVLGATTTGNIRIGTDATARTLSLGNSTGASALSFTSGTGSQLFTSSVASTASTSSGFAFVANSLTTGTGMYVGSYNTAFTSGALAQIDYSPGSTPTTSPTGDILKLSLGTNATNFLGNYFNIVNSTSTSLFSISETAFSTSLPVNFTAPGDVGNAYDLIFTNPVVSNIKSSAPLYIIAGEVFNSSNLGLQTYNEGTIVISTGNTTSTAIDYTNTTLTTGTGINISLSGITSGTGLSLAQTTSTFTGNLAAINLGTGTGTALNVTNGGTGASFRVNDDGTFTDTTAFLIDAGGNVGIGNTTPVATLDVRGTLATIPAASISAVSNSFAALVVDARGTGDVFTASASGLNRFVIKNNGTIGVGTALPVAVFDLNGSGGISGTTAKNLLRIANTDTTAASVAAMMTFFGNRNGNVATAIASISAVLADNTGLGYNGDLVFSTANVANVPAERMRINGFGNVGIGTTTLVKKLTVNGVIRSGNTLAVDIDGNNGAGPLIRWNDTTVTDYLTIGATGGTNNIDSLGRDFRIYSTLAPSGFIMKQDTGSIGLGTTTPLATLDIRGNSGTTAVASISAFSNSFAGMVVDNRGLGDIFTASSSGLARFIIKNNGNVGIGSVGQFRMDISDSQAATLSAMITNSNTGANTSVLGLKVGAASPGTGNYFATFMNGNGEIIGKIQGNGSNGVSYTTSGIDFAEYYKKENKDEVFSEGDIVCLSKNGGVTLCSAGNEPLGVISAHPGFVGGIDREKDSSYALVGLIGQVPVKIASTSGVIRSSDALIASEIAGSVKVASTSGYIIGRALESYDPSLNPEKKTIMMSVGVRWYESSFFGGSESLFAPITPGNIGNATPPVDFSGENATISGNLMVLGTATVSDLGVTGKIHTGVLSIDGINGEIHTIGGPLKLQEAGVDGIDILSGKVTIDRTGNMNVNGTLTADTLKTDKIILKGNKSTGSDTLPAGQKSIVISAPSAAVTAKIFVVPTTITTKQLSVSAKGNGTFTVSIATADTKDIDFDWVIIGNEQ